MATKTKRSLCPIERRDIFGNCLKTPNPPLRAHKGFYSLPTSFSDRSRPGPGPGPDPNPNPRSRKKKQSHFTPGSLINPRKYPVSELTLEMQEALHVAHASQIYQKNMAERMPLYDDSMNMDSADLISKTSRGALAQHYLDERYPKRFEVDYTKSSDNVLVLKRYKNTERRLQQQQQLEAERGMPSMTPPPSVDPAMDLPERPRRERRKRGFAEIEAETGRRAQRDPLDGFEGKMRDAIMNRHAGETKPDLFGETTDIPSIDDQPLPRTANGEIDFDLLNDPVRTERANSRYVADQRGGAGSGYKLKGQRTKKGSSSDENQKKVTSPEGRDSVFEGGSLAGGYGGARRMPGMNNNKDSLDKIRRDRNNNDILGHKAQTDAEKEAARHEYLEILKRLQQFSSDVDLSEKLVPPHPQESSRNGVRGVGEEIEVGSSETKTYEPQPQPSPQEVKGPNGETKTYEPQPQQPSPQEVKGFGLGGSPQRQRRQRSNTDEARQLRNTDASETKTNDQEVSSLGSEGAWFEPTAEDYEFVVSHPGSRTNVGARDTKVDWLGNFKGLWNSWLEKQVGFDAVKKKLQFKNITENKGLLSEIAGVHQNIAETNVRTRYVTGNSRGGYAAVTGTNEAQKAGTINQDAKVYAHNTANIHGTDEASAEIVNRVGSNDTLFHLRSQYDIASAMRLFGFGEKVPPGTNLTHAGNPREVGYASRHGIYSNANATQRAGAEKVFKFMQKAVISGAKHAQMQMHHDIISGIDEDNHKNLNEFLRSKGKSYDEFTPRKRALLDKLWKHSWEQKQTRKGQPDDSFGYSKKTRVAPDEYRPLPENPTYEPFGRDPLSERNFLHDDVLHTSHRNGQEILNFSQQPKAGRELSLKTEETTRTNIDTHIKNLHNEMENPSYSSRAARGLQNFTKGAAEQSAGAVAGFFADKGLVSSEDLFLQHSGLVDTRKDEKGEEVLDKGKTLAVGQSLTNAGLLNVGFDKAMAKYTGEDFSAGTAGLSFAEGGVGMVGGMLGAEATEKLGDAVGGPVGTAIKSDYGQSVGSGIGAVASMKGFQKIKNLATSASESTEAAAGAGEGAEGASAALEAGSGLLEAGAAEDVLGGLIAFGSGVGEIAAAGVVLGTVGYGLSKMWDKWTGNTSEEPQPPPTSPEPTTVSDPGRIGF